MSMWFEKNHWLRQRFDACIVLFVGIELLGGGFKDCLFSTLPVEIIQFD